MRVVRWLGAYGKSKSLHESLNFELSRPHADEIAAEPLTDGKSEIAHARIGLLVARKAVIKIFTGDCFSILDSGRLKKTRNPVPSHGEAWANPVYAGIVVKNFENLGSSAKKTVRWFSQTYSLPVIEYKNWRKIM